MRRMPTTQEDRTANSQLASIFLYKPWYSPDKDDQGFFYFSNTLEKKHFLG